MKNKQQRVADAIALLEKLTGKKVSLAEDVYYEPKPQYVDHAAVIESIVEKFVDEQVGLESAGFVVKYGYDVIDVLHRSEVRKQIRQRDTAPNPEGDKRATQEWTDMANELIELLSRQSSLYDYELVLIGKHGFTLQLKDEASEKAKQSRSMY